MPVLGLPLVGITAIVLSRDNGNCFEKFSPAPIMARNHHDPCLVTAPYVLKETDKWRMYYISALRWEKIGNKARIFQLVF